MQAAGRSVKHEVEIFGDGADALQGPAQESGEIRSQAGLVQASTLKGRIVIAGENPGFVGNAWGVRPQGEVVAAHLNHALGLAFFLLDDVAEDTALFADEIFSSGAQFVEDAPRDEQGCGELRGRMAEFLSGVGTVILEQADVLDARIALEIEDALSGKTEEVGDVLVTGLPQMTIVIRIFDEHFMGAHGLHAVIETVAAASGLAFDMVERSRVDHGTCRPGRPGRIGRVRDYMQAGIGAERARRVGTGSGIAGIVAGHDPGAGDWVLAKFHRKKKENTGEKWSQLPIAAEFSTGCMRNHREGPCAVFVIIRRSPLR